MISSCISLVGPSASGKSSVGPLLADYLKFNFFDSDIFISQKIGKEISEIFSEKGIEFIQHKNIEILEELYMNITGSNSIIAIGGSAIQLRYLRKFIKTSSSLVVGLYADPQVLINRISNSIIDCKHAAHPLIVFEDGISFSKLLFEFREPFTFFADELIDTSKLTIQEVLDKLITISQNFLKENTNYHA